MAYFSKLHWLSCPWPDPRTKSYSLMSCFCEVSAGPPSLFLLVCLLHLEVPGYSDPMVTLWSWGRRQKTNLGSGGWKKEVNQMGDCQGGCTKFQRTERCSMRSRQSSRWKWLLSLSLSLLPLWHSSYDHTLAPSPSITQTHWTRVGNFYCPLKFQKCIPKAILHVKKCNMSCCSEDSTPAQDGALWIFGCTAKLHLKSHAV